MAGIDNIRSGHSLNTTNRAPARSNSDASSSTSSASSARGAKQDSVSLSHQGRAIGEMHNDMTTTPSFDSAKVAAIKEAIANGSYVVDSEKLADNIMKFEKELGGLG